MARLSIVETHTLPEVWWKCLREILLHGNRYTIDSGSFAGHDRIELDSITLSVTMPSSRPLAPQIPIGLDVMPPASEVSIEDYANQLLDVNVPDGSRYDYLYGEFLNPQIDAAIKIYTEKGYKTNRCCMMVGGKESIMLYGSESPENERHSPCLRVVDTVIRNNKLHFHCYFRSWDAWAGLPMNLGGLTLVMEFIAGAIGIEPGSLVAYSKGLHLYDFEIPWAEQVMGGLYG